MHKNVLLIGKILKIFICFFFLFDAVMKLIKNKSSMDATIELGLPQNAVQFLGGYLLIGTLLYAISKTSLFGLLLVIGYLGGAVAVMYISKPEGYAYFFPLFFAVLAVLAMYLQNPIFKNALILHTNR